MTLDEFFDELKALPVHWQYIGDAIRTHDGGSSEAFSPMEVLCYSKGGTVSWRPGRIHRPRLLDDFFVHGRLLGLSEQDTHAIFRASDNDINPEKQGYNERDGMIRRRLIEICRPFDYKKLLNHVKENKGRI